MIGTDLGKVATFHTGLKEGFKFVSLAKILKLLVSLFWKMQFRS